MIDAAAGTALGLSLGVLAYAWYRPGSWLHEALHLPGLWLRNRRLVGAGLVWDRVPYGPRSRQYLLVTPPRGEGRGTAIVFFHGGAWQFGRPEQFLAYAAFFSRRGYPVILPSYRKIPPNTFDALLGDLALVMETVAGICEQKGWAERGLIVGGMSSGGHLAAHAVLNPRLAPRGLPISGGMLLASPLSLRQLRPALVRRLLAGPVRGDRFRRADPSAQVGQDPLPDLLIIHGTADGLVPYRCSADFAAWAAEQGHRNIRFHTLPRGGHLEVISWLHTPGSLREEVLAWVERKAREP